MTKHDSKARPPALLFDLDGTLIDSVYQHVLAWREALEAEDIQLVHRRIGMSGGLIIHAFFREAGRQLDRKEIARLQKLHTEAFMKWQFVFCRARDLLETLSRLGVCWAIATIGSREGAEQPLQLLDLDEDVPVITRDDAQRAKPDPDLFLAAARKLGAALEDCVVVGDSIWDLLAAQRARALGVGLLSGGFGEHELMNAGAYRVYRDAAGLNAHLDEIGIRVI
jgi:HAD superfamily hydrolase (TIGR01509 family)